MTSISSAATTTVPVRKPWTILVYSAGDNSLKDYLIQNLDDCEKVGSTDCVNIVSQLDVGGTEGANRIFITQDNQPGLHSPVVQKMGPIDMASPDTLADFVEWGMKNYPADHTMLILSDHGYGWRGAIEDNSAGRHVLGFPIPKRMSLPEVQKALQTARQATGQKVDVLGWDACLMGSAEVAAQLKDEASYMVASEETEDDRGWPYTQIMSPTMLQNVETAIHHKALTTPRDFAALVVRSATAGQGEIPTLAAYDMKQVPALTQAVKSFASAIAGTDTRAGILRGLARQSQAFRVYKVIPYRDLYDFASRVEQSPQVVDAHLKTAAAGVQQAIRGAIFAEEHSPKYPGAHGVTVELGTVFFSPCHRYRNLDMPRETDWDRALDKIGTYWFSPVPL